MDTEHERNWHLICFSFLFAWLKMIKFLSKWFLIRNDHSPFLFDRNQTVNVHAGQSSPGFSRSAAFARRWQIYKKKRRQDLTEGKTQTVHSASSVTPLCTSRRGELEEKVWWEAEEFKKKINKRIEDGAGGQIRTLLNPLWHGYNEAKHETINHTSPKV